MRLPRCYLECVHKLKYKEILIGYNEGGRSLPPYWRIQPWHGTPSLGSHCHANLAGVMSQMSFGPRSNPSCPSMFGHPREVDHRRPIGRSSTESCMSSRTGCQWKMLPREYGSGSAAHEHFQKWARAGVFSKLWKLCLLEYDRCKGIDWKCSWAAEPEPYSRWRHLPLASGPQDIQDSVEDRPMGRRWSTSLG